MKKLLFILFVFFVGTLKGQIGLNFPVKGQALVTPPVTSQLEDLSNPLNHPIIVKLFNEDQKLANKQVYLDLFIDGPVSGRSNSKTNQFELRVKTPTNVSSQVIAQLFSPENLRVDDYNKPLPAGIYTFQFVVREVFSDEILSEPFVSAPLWIESSDPPLPIYPINFASVEPSQVQNVVFQWLPRHAPNINIEYEFTLTELPIANRGNLQNIFLSQPPILKTTSAFPTIVYDARFPQLRKGAVYAWRVQARPKLGAASKVSNFLNSGYSEIFSFVYDAEIGGLNPPRNLLAEKSSDYNKIFVDFQGDDNHANYSVVFNNARPKYIDNDPEKGILKLEYYEFDNLIVDKGENNETKFELKVSINRSEDKMKLVVRARDVFGRESEPVEYIIEPIERDIINKKLDDRITLEGKVEGYSLNYAYEGYSMKPTVIGENPYRIALKNVEVCAFLSEYEIKEKTIEEFKRNRSSNTGGGDVFITCGFTDSDGKYSLSGPRLTRISLNMKYVYLTFDSRDNQFSHAITEVYVPGRNETGTVRTLKTQKLLSENFSIVPAIITKIGYIPNKDFEEVSIYLKKSHFEQNRFLIQDVNKYASTEIIYNKETYVKVGDYKDSYYDKTREGHNYYGGAYIIGIKEVAFDKKYYPLLDLNMADITKRRGKNFSTRINQGKEPHLERNLLDYINVQYDLALPKISGQVAVRKKNSQGAGDIPVANLEVGIVAFSKFRDFTEVVTLEKYKTPNDYLKIHWEEVQTDQNGNYSFIIPESLYNNEDVGEIIIYNRIPGIWDYRQIKVIAKPKENITVNLDIMSSGTVVASRLYNQFGKPVSGAKIIHSTSGIFATTNDLGEFIVNFPYSPVVDEDPSFTIEANGYIASSQKLSDFVKTSKEIEEVSADFGLEFWNQNIEALKELTGGTFEGTSEAKIHRINFKNSNSYLTSFYKKDSIAIESMQYMVRIKLFTSEEEEGETKLTNTPGTIEFEGALIDIPEEGLTQFMATGGVVFKGTTKNRDQNAEIYYVESDFEVEFDEPESKRDTINIEIEIKPAVLIAGTITGYNPDSTEIGKEAGVTISVEGIEDVETDENGNFQIWLEKDAEEVTLTLTKDDYNTTEVAFTTKVKTDAERTRDFVKDSEDETEYATFEELRDLSLAIFAKDSLIPDFETLQGFKVEITTITKGAGETFLMSGSINLEDQESFYELEEGEELTFEELEVEIDDFAETNAVLVEDAADLDQETLSLKLFGYADVESSTVSLVKLKLEGRETYGKIGGENLKFLPKKIMRKVQNSIFQEFELKLDSPEEPGKVELNNDISAGNQKKLAKEKKAAEKKGKSSKSDSKKTEIKNTKPKAEPKKEKEEEKEEEEEEEEGSIIPFFVSGGKNLKDFNEDLEFILEYPEEDENGVVRKDAKDDKGKKTGKKEPLIFGLGSGFSMHIDEDQEATLSKQGVIFNGGSMAIPAMKKLGVEGKMPLVEKLLLAPEEELPMREFFLKKKPDSTGKTAPYFTLGVANSWRLAVDRFQFFDEFASVGLGGNMYTDKTNYLIIHSMSIRKGPDGSYPFLNLEFPEKGFKIKQLVLKSPEGQQILCGYNFEDQAYEVEAGVIMEVTKDAHQMVKKIFPIEIEKLVYNTAGKFFLSLKINKSIEIGPVKVNIRKIQFNKGGGVSWPEMLQMLQMSSDEAVAFSKTEKYNNKNYREINKKKNQTVSLDAYMEEVDDVQLATGEVDWAFGFAGGVEVKDIKGVNAKADASFIFGEREGKLSFQFNTITIIMESPAFKALMYLDLSTEGDRVGFAGRGKLETLTQKWEASCKFFKMAEGIEFGVSIIVNSKIRTGPITWTSVGGGVDINTATKKYRVFFLGSAVAGETPPDKSELRNIIIEVAFESNSLAIKGAADWYLNNEKFCAANFLLDFGNSTVFANIDCFKKVTNGIEGRVVATLFINPKTVFLGVNLKANVLGIPVNAVIALGLNTDFESDGTSLIRNYRELIGDKYLIRGRILNGIFVKADANIEFKSSLNILVFQYSFKLATSNEVIIFQSFSSSTFMYQNDFKLAVSLYVKVGISPLSSSASGTLDVRLLINGGYNETDGLNFLGDVAVVLKVGSSMDVGCGSFRLDWCKFLGVPYPCGVEWKVCYDQRVRVIYRQMGPGKGYTVKL